MSLKAELSDTQPTEQDKPNKAPDRKGADEKDVGKKSLKQVAEEKNAVNPTMLGDPVRLFLVRWRSGVGLEFGNLTLCSGVIEGGDVGHGANKGRPGRAGDRQ